MYIYLDPPQDSWKQKGWWGFDKYEDLKRHLKLANLAKGEVKTILDGIQMDFWQYRDIILQAEREFGMTKA